MVSLHHGQLSHGSVILRKRPGRDGVWGTGGGKQGQASSHTDSSAYPHWPSRASSQPQIIFPITQASPSPPTKLHTRACQNVVSTCKVREMKGTLKSRQGMGCWDPGGTWDEIYSLLLGFLLLGIHKARVGPECMEPPSSAHPQALEAMPQCPLSGTGGHLGLPQAKVSMSTSSRLAPTPGLQTQQL